MFLTSICPDVGLHELDFRFEVFAFEEELGLHESGCQFPPGVLVVGSRGQC